WEGFQSGHVNTDVPFRAASRARVSESKPFRDAPPGFSAKAAPTSASAGTRNNPLITCKACGLGSHRKAVRKGTRRKNLYGGRSSKKFGGHVRPPAPVKRKCAPARISTHPGSGVAARCAHKNLIDVLHGFENCSSVRTREPTGTCLSLSLSLCLRVSLRPAGGLAVGPACAAAPRSLPVD
ncbi:MAG: hypothetical protein BJ554DRAFT_3136, partial [Olpidium bornovanus]